MEILSSPEFSSQSPTCSYAETYFKHCNQIFLFQPFGKSDTFSQEKKNLPFYTSNWQQNRFESESEDGFLLKLSCFRMGVEV